MISKYQQKRQEILAACKAEREKLGVAEQKTLANKCPTPEVALISSATLSPGQTAEVTVTGKFPAGTRFLFDSDCIEVVKESVTANTYHATVKVGSDCGPEAVTVEAFAPFCCKSGRLDHGLTVGGNFNWDLTAGNGWRVKGHPVPPTAGAGKTSELAFMLEFYRGSETTPFTKRSATLFPSAGSSPPSYYFSISNQDESSTNAQQEMERISRQMANPNISEAERAKLMSQMQAILTNMTKDASKMMDPAYQKQLQAQADEFGCQTINVTVQNGSVTGTMTCSQKVGSNLKITGTLKFLGK
jgi:FKBP-type peptidyl-prolyl cis-trans isomerase